LFNVLIGQKIWKSGPIYEGEWKDSKQHGQGKKSNFLILALFNNLIGELFENNGIRYEGEWKDGAYYG